MQITVIFHFLHSILLSVMFFSPEMNAIYTSCVCLCILVVIVVHSVAIIEVASQFSSSFHIFFLSFFATLELSGWFVAPAITFFRLMQIYSPIIVCTHFKRNINIYSHIIFMKTKKTNEFNTLQHFLHAHYFEWVLIYVLKIAAKTDFFLSFRFQCVGFVSVRDGVCTNTLLKNISFHTLNAIYNWCINKFK